jgi:hypothetical protein
MTLTRGWHAFVHHFFILYYLIQVNSSTVLHMLILSFTFRLIKKCNQFSCFHVLKRVNAIYSPRADDEFGEGILGNQKLKKMYYLNVSESGIDSR